MPIHHIRSSSNVLPDAVLLQWQVAGERADYTDILEQNAATPERIRYFVAHGYSHLGTMLAGDGSWQESMEAYRKSAEMFETLVQDSSRNTDYRFRLALAERRRRKAREGSSIPPKSSTRPGSAAPS